MIPEFAKERKIIYSKNNQKNNKMKWEGIKRILFGIPEELSLDERKIAMKTGLIVLGILFSIATLLYLLFFLGPELETGEIDIFGIIILISFLFVSFSCLEIVFKRKGFFVLVKIFLLFIFAFSLIYLGYSYGTLIAKIGWLTLLGWLVYFIREIFRLTKDFLRRKDGESIKEEIGPEFRGFQRTFPKSSWLNKNLGFKGFIWALLIFSGIFIFIYLIAYLTK